MKKTEHGSLAIDYVRLKVWEQMLPIYEAFGHPIPPKPEPSKHVYNPYDYHDDP